MLKEERDYLIDSGNFKLLECLEEAYREGLQEGQKAATNLELLFSIIRTGALTIDQAYQFIKTNSEYENMVEDKQQFENMYRKSGDVNFSAGDSL